MTKKNREWVSDKTTDWYTKTRKHQIKGRFCFFSDWIRCFVWKLFFGHSRYFWTPLNSTEIRIDFSFGRKIWNFRNLLFEKKFPPELYFICFGACSHEDSNLCEDSLRLPLSAATTVQQLYWAPRTLAQLILISLQANGSSFFAAPFLIYGSTVYEVFSGSELTGTYIDMARLQPGISYCSSKYQSLWTLLWLVKI